MKHSPAIRDASPADMEELYRELESPDDILSIESRLQAHDLTQRCMREREDERRQDRVELLVTEAAEVVTAVTAGAVSTYYADRPFQAGAAVNYVVGTLAKIGSAAYAVRLPENISGAGRAARTACRVGKTLLHTQLGIFTRKTILDE